MRDQKIVVLGAGIAGLTAAIALRQIGFDPLVFESANEIKGIGAGFGLASNAIKAFGCLGLAEEVTALGRWLDSFDICDQWGNTLIRTDPSKLRDLYQAENFAYHRADLHQFLLSKLPASSIVTAKRGQYIQQDKQGITLFFHDGSDIRCDYLLVADGVRSAIRQQLCPSSKPRYAGYTCWRGVVDNRSIGLAKGVETWGAKGRIGMTPLSKDRLYWYACVNAKANDVQYRNYGVSDLHKRFADYHDPIPHVIAATKQVDLLWNDIIDVKPLKHFAFDRVLLMGDAAHATTPNMGQGACQAIEDAVILQVEMQKQQPIEAAFVAFERRRLGRTRYITDTSRQAGWLAQWDNPFWVSLRNTLLKTVPQSIVQYNLKKLYNSDFLQEKA